ncbi:aspartate/glutamate racemase family protein [Actinoplanes teichomyceticus]|uniref:Aspartate racemase n=1 Tax=Actinoplanes teichomyceticus TaxID=1867 RepID=A0A561VID6_ACTTI|nr:aspartate/glutamate racemase family protein [Actinoplanes teichomyceticus]TWG11344.1 aspartate racemase [Actinoplanes teichomyceticus]GIF16378.1 aspartate racemase [Actinoplanes teichomyceticus]
MQLIGLLGGMSWQSTAEYYRLLNELVQDRAEGLHSARCLLYSVDFAAIEAMQAQGRWDEAAVALGQAARALETAGADFVVLCTNTMHKVADRIQAAIGIPLLHLADTTAAAVKEAGVTTVGLLGTRFTMSEDFYRDRLAGHGLRVIVPGPEDQRIVSDIIYDELCRGITTQRSREAYRRVIRQLVADGARGIVYGCTEIELLVDQSDSEVPVFATTRLHCVAAVERALASAPVRRPGLP